MRRHSLGTLVGLCMLGLAAPTWAVPMSTDAVWRNHGDRRSRACARLGCGLARDDDGHVGHRRLRGARGF